MCACLPVCTYLSVYVYVRVCPSACLSVRTCVRVYVRVYVYVYVFVYVYVYGVAINPTINNPRENWQFCFHLALAMGNFSVIYNGLEKTRTRDLKKQCWRKLYTYWSRSITGYFQVMEEIISIFTDFHFCMLEKFCLINWNNVNERNQI